MDSIKDKISNFLDDSFEPEEGTLPAVIPEETDPLAPYDEADNINMETGELVPVEATGSQKKFAKQAEEDFDLVRTAMREAVVNGSLVLDRMTELSREHQEGAWFKVFGEYLEKFAITANSVLELHQQKDSLAAFVDTGSHAEPENTGAININGNAQIVFTGTTADLKKQLKKQKAELPPIDHDEDDE